MSFSVEDCIEVPVTKKETVHLLFNLQQAYGDTATICRTYNVTSDELEKAYADKLLIPGMNVACAWRIMQFVVESICANDVASDLRSAIIRAMDVSSKSPLVGKPRGR